MPSLEQARRWYDDDDPVHGYDHILRVLRLALYLAEQVGADPQIVRAAALLHDASGAHPSGEQDRVLHENSSAEFAREILEKEGWGRKRIEAVVHCIQTHRYRGGKEPRTLEAKVLYDADKLDVCGAFGIARTLGYAIQAGQPIYSPLSETFRTSGRLEKGETHSAYHEYIFKLRNVRDSLHTKPARELAAHRHEVLTAFFEQLNDEADGMNPRWVDTPD